MAIETDLRKAGGATTNITATFLKTWNSLTAPSSSITNAEDQRRARLLAATLIIILITGALILVARAILVPKTVGDVDFLSATVSWFVVSVFYLLTRRGHINFAAAALIALLFVLFVMVAFAPNSLPTLLYFTIIPILLTALFFSVRQVIGITVLAVIVPLLLSPFTSRPGFESVVTAVQFIVLSAAVVVVYINHTHALELIRRTELQNAYDKVRASEAVLEQRVRERTQDLSLAKEEAEKAREQAELANQTKSQFLASMSHELRTPLNAILTFSELIAMGTLGPVNEEQVEYLQKSLQSGKHLLSLINDVLDITKIQSGTMKLFIESDFDVAKEMANIAVSAEKLLKDKPVKLVMDIDSSFLPMTCDKRRVRQVLLNLISNAVKFTDQGTITLSAKNRDHEVLFAVSDTGPGISKDEQEIIFEPFVQTEAGIKHAGGTGLGLPISKRLTEVHGGRLWVESEPGQGSAFYAVFPLRSDFKLGEQEM